MISLKQWMSTVVQNFNTHVSTLVSQGVHGISGWGGEPKALDAQASPGTEVTVSRGDHVHPNPQTWADGRYAAKAGTSNQDFTTKDLTVNGNLLVGYGQENPGYVQVNGLLSVNNRIDAEGYRTRTGTGTWQAWAYNLSYDWEDDWYGFRLWLGNVNEGKIVTSSRLSNASPPALGTGSGGTSNYVSRSDHVHPKPSAADVGALPSSGGTVTGFTAIMASLQAQFITPESHLLYNIGTFEKCYQYVYCHGIIEASDERRKTDIETSDLGLAFVRSLRPVKYRWQVGGYLDQEDPEETSGRRCIPKPGVRMHYGLLAQQVEEALAGQDFGGFVRDAETGDMGLRYSQFFAPIIRAVQELADRVDALESRQ